MRGTATRSCSTRWWWSSWMTWRCRCARRQQQPPLVDDSGMVCQASTEGWLALRRPHVLQLPPHQLTGCATACLPACLPDRPPARLPACLQVEGRMPDSAYPLRMLQTISRHLYVDRGFKGNTEVRLWEHALSAGAAAMPCAPAGRILMLRCCRPFLASQQRPYRKTSASSHLDHCRTTTIRTTAASIACWRRAGASQSRWHWCTCRCIGGACGGAVQ